MQRDARIGWIISSLMRALAAKLKQSFSEVGKQDLKTGTETIGYVIKGQDSKTLLKRGAK